LQVDHITGVPMNAVFIHNARTNTADIIGVLGTGERIYIDRTSELVYRRIPNPYDEFSDGDRVEALTDNAWHFVGWWITSFQRQSIVRQVH
jgi:hypothetical protein